MKKVHPLERGNEGGPEELDDTDNPRWVPLEYIYIIYLAVDVGT